MSYCFQHLVSHTVGTGSFGGHVECGILGVRSLQNPSFYFSHHPVYYLADYCIL